MLSLKKNSHTCKTHYSKLLALGVFTSVMSLSALAEPRVQPGETLESLSKARISTTVNGQNASLENLVNSGQIRLVQPSQAPTMQSNPSSGMQSGQPGMSQAPGMMRHSQDPAMMRQGSTPDMQQPNDPRTLPEMQQDSPMTPAGSTAPGVTTP